MSYTEFGKLSEAQVKVWAKDLWLTAKHNSFVNRFMGTDQGSMIQVVKELTKTSKGDKAIIQLVGDLQEDGVVGDNESEGNEEAMQAHVQEIKLDMISHAVINKGKLSDQRSTINFRSTGKNSLAEWLSQRIDELAMLTAAGISYEYKTNGAKRSSNSQFPVLEFATDVKAPTSERGLMWTGAGLDYSSTANITNAFVPKYNMIVDLVIHEHSDVFNTKGAAAGDKWGAGGNVNGTRTMLCGAQALAMLDLGLPDWNEKSFNYGKRHGINVDKFLGLLKPQFESAVTGAVEDHAILTCDHYLA
ncbi:DUF4043 family protein [Comamonas aquatica]|uniref:phage capsid family protein n=1 Tax=Comamonas aquatica TaxID=225991 RepID=UPI0031CECDB2